MTVSELKFGTCFFPLALEGCAFCIVCFFFHFYSPLNADTIRHSYTENRKEKKKKKKVPSIVLVRSTVVCSISEEPHRLQGKITPRGVYKVFFCLYAFPPKGGGGLQNIYISGVINANK